MPDALHQSDPTPRRGAAGGCVVLLLCTAAAYLPFVGIPYYADDYYYLFENPRAAIYEYFISYHDVGGIFRPFQMAWCAVHQLFFGESTVWLESGQVLLHGLLSCTVFRFLRREGVDGRAAFVAALLLACHPACVSGVLGNDTVSQIGSTFFGFLAFTRVWRIGRELHDGRPCPFLAAVWMVAFLALALLFKETGLSFAAILPAAALFWAYRCHTAGLRTAARKLIVLIGTLAAATVVYMLYRGQMAPTRLRFGDESGYQFHLGGNILVNQAFLFGASFLPASTADLFMAICRRAWPILSLVAVLISVWIGFLAFGLKRGGAVKQAAGALLLASLATLPVTLMNHVSELYTYNMSPFIALAVAAAMKAWLAPGPRVATSKWVAWLILLLVVSGNVHAITNKARLMQANGRAAMVLSEQVVEHAKRLPTNGSLLLVERGRAGACLYSIFRTSDFQGLLVAERWLKHRAGRPDVHIRVVHERDRGSADLRFTRQGDALEARLVPWEPGG